MILLKKKEKENSHQIILTSLIGNIKIFFTDTQIKLPKDILITNNKSNLFFQKQDLLLTLTVNSNIHVLSYKKSIFFASNLKKKKDLLHLYQKLIKQKIKGISHGFKFNLILKGIGFKVFIEKTTLKFKIGFSHFKIREIPDNIHVIQQGSNLIFQSSDLLTLSQFIHSLKKLKRVDPYKGKGILLKNEKIILKEGKKTKK